MITIEILQEHGIVAALYGMGLSYGKTSDVDFKKFCWPMDKENIYFRLRDKAAELAQNDTGENKFLEHVMVWLLVRAPRHWWQEADTYRISSKQSESTMHTLMSKPLTQEDFSSPIPEPYLEYLNTLIEMKQEDLLRDSLPEGYLQRREWVLSYKELRHIYHQRKDHRKKEWREFCKFLVKNLECPEYLMPL